MIDINAIRARADAATPGPWHLNPWPPNGPNVHQGKTAQGIPITADDAEFIAAARSDVPALCDEVERLSAEVARLRTALARIPEVYCGCAGDGPCPCCAHCEIARDALTVQVKA